MKISILASCMLVACATNTVVTEAPKPAPTTAPTAPEPEPTAPAVTRVEGKTDTLFGAEAKSYANVRDEDGVVVSVGVVIPLAAFTAAPTNAPFQDDLVLEMPKVARDQTVLHHLRVNWLVNGHGPSPYGSPHFDLHFLRGTVDEVDAFDCRADMRMPSADRIPAGYGTPETCVNAQGYHSWPTADKAAGAKFTASLIMGYFGGKFVFVEPMIAKTVLLEKKSFELTVPKPESAGGTRSLYPTHMAAKWDEATASYAFEFDGLEEID